MSVDVPQHTQSSTHARGKLKERSLINGSGQKGKLTARSAASFEKCVMAYPAAAFGPNCSSPVDPIECDCALAVIVHAAAEMRRVKDRMAICVIGSGPT